MTIDVHIEAESIKHISVTGENASRDAIEILLKQLEDERFKEISITFFDANIIHSDLLEKLDYIGRVKRCKIYVFKRYLRTYLYNLGINCEYVERKSLHSKEPLDKREEQLNEYEVKRFIENINSRYGYDYTGYQIESIMRRIKLCMLRENIRSFKEFQEVVLEDAGVFEHLFLDFSINTTEFFRDPEVFQMIRNKILTYIDSYNHIKIWCAGCSNGKEAYSMAIMLEELGLLNKAQIYATDINPYIIEEAKNGLFSVNDIDKYILNYKKAGGKRSFVDYFDLRENYMRVKSYLCKNILFFQHSLIGSGSLNEFALILCRNVLIYFNPELQRGVLENFYNSLDKSGFLVLGKSEGLMLNNGERYFTSYLEKEKIYRARES